MIFLNHLQPYNVVDERGKNVRCCVHTCAVHIDRRYYVESVSMGQFAEILHILIHTSALDKPEIY